MGLIIEELFSTPVISGGVMGDLPLEDRLKATTNARENCGTGDGGFQPGNTCAQGGSTNQDVDTSGLPLARSAWWRDLKSKTYREDLRDRARDGERITIVPEIDRLYHYATDDGFKLDEAETVYFGLSGDQFKDMPVGATFEALGTRSTAFDKERADRYGADGGVFKVTVPAGSHAVRAKVLGVRELMLLPGASFRVTGRSGGVTHLEMTGDGSEHVKDLWGFQQELTELSKPAANASENCGTGAGGFQPGNTCAKSDGRSEIISADQVRPKPKAGKVSTGKASSKADSPSYSASDLVAELRAAGVNPHDRMGWQDGDPLGIGKIKVDAAKERAVGEAVLKAVQRQKADNPFQRLDVAKLHEEAGQGLTVRQFQAVLLRSPALRLGPFTQALAEHPDPRWLIPTRAGTLFYVEPRVTTNAGENCGTGAGGFQPGNTCAKGGEGALFEDEPRGAKHPDGLNRERAAAIKEAEEIVQTYIDGGRSVSVGAGWDGLSESDKESAFDSYREGAESNVLEQLEKDWYKEQENDIENEVDEIHNDDAVGGELLREWLHDQEGGLEIYERLEEAGWEQAVTLSGGDLEIKNSDANKEDLLAFMEEGDRYKELDAFVKEGLSERYESMKEEKLEELRGGEIPDRVREHLYEQAYEQIIEDWSGLSDEEKLKHAGVDAADIEVEEPKQFKITKNGRDYERSRGQVLAVQQEMTLREVAKRGLRVADGGDVDSAKLASDVWSEWKSSSTSDKGLLLQWAAAEELGGHLQELNEGQLKSVSRAALSLYREHLGGPASGEEMERQGRELMKAHVRATWAATQYAMHRAGQAEVEAYRGLMLPKEALEGAKEDKVPYKIGEMDFEHVKLPDLRLKRNGAASTAAEDHGLSVANGWNGIGAVPAGAKRVVLRLRLKAEDVLSLPVFGQNVHEEHEVVAIGGRWRWDAWLNRAPNMKEVPLE